MVTGTIWGPSSTVPTPLALKDHGQPQRFFILNTGDQTAKVIVGDQEKLEALAMMYHIPIILDAIAGQQQYQIGPKVA